LDAGFTGAGRAAAVLLPKSRTQVWHQFGDVNGLHRWHSFGKIEDEVALTDLVGTSSSSLMSFSDGTAVII
jgi:hypothetical protein